MTIIEAINDIDSLKPNAYSETDKIKWLERLDWAVKKEIIDTHEGGEDVIFEGFGEPVDLNTELLVPAPYDEVYLRWLEAQIDYANGEYGKFNNSMNMYNTAYSAYERYYNRTHMPFGKTRNYF